MTRRDLACAAGAGLAALLFGACGGGRGSAAPDTTKIWRLSSYGRRTSNAAKVHNANKRFPTALAAHLNRAHPGDNSKVVSLDTTPATWQALFGMGEQVVDVRDLPDELKALAG
jgi:hypothetical protein